MLTSPRYIIIIIARRVALLLLAPKSNTKDADAITLCL